MGQRTPEELREQSKHLLSEVQMLFALGRYLETGVVDAAVAHLDRAGLPVRNAVIEAYEIHARQLIDCRGAPAWAVALSGCLYRPSAPGHAHAAGRTEKRGPTESRPWLRSK